jgi:hypothetical protein
VAGEVGGECLDVENLINVGAILDWEGLVRRRVADVVHECNKTFAADGRENGRSKVVTTCADG